MKKISKYEYNLNFMYLLVEKQFENIKDKIDRDYFIHCFNVYTNVLRSIETYSKLYNFIYTKEDHSIYQITSLGHDIIEDLSDGEELLIACLNKKIINKQCIDSIKILTKIKNESYNSYIQKIVDSNDEYAILTKICDIQEHLNNIHLIIDNKTKDRLLKKYNLENLNSLINKYVEIKSKR